MCRLHLDHIGHLEEMIAKLDAQIEAMMAPFRTEWDLLTTIPGIGPLAAAAIISEIGASVTEYLPDAARLASWAGLCPGNHESAGKRHSGRRRHGNPHLQPVLVETAWTAVRHDGYLKSLYHRHVMKWGGYRSPTAKKKAIIVVVISSAFSGVHDVADVSLCCVVDALSSAVSTTYRKLCHPRDLRLSPLSLPLLSSQPRREPHVSDMSTTQNPAPHQTLRRARRPLLHPPPGPDRETRRLIAKLEALGHQVSLQPAA